MVVPVALLLSTVLLGNADAVDSRVLPDIVPIDDRVPIGNHADSALVFLYGHWIDPPWYINCELAAQGDTLRLNDIPVWPRLPDGSTFDSYSQIGPRWDRGLPQWNFSGRGAPMAGTHCADTTIVGRAACGQAAWLMMTLARGWAILIGHDYCYRMPRESARQLVASIDPTCTEAPADRLYQLFVRDYRMAARTTVAPNKRLQRAIAGDHDTGGFRSRR